MADPERIFRDALVADSAVTAFFTGGVHFLRAPESARPPYAVITLVGERRDGTLTGPDALPQALVEAQVIGTTLAQAGEGRGLVRARMDALITTDIAMCRLETQQATIDDETEWPRAICDYRLIYKET